MNKKNTKIGVYESLYALEFFFNVSSLEYFEYSYECDVLDYHK